MNVERSEDPTENRKKLGDLGGRCTRPKQFHTHFYYGFSKGDMSSLGKLALHSRGTQSEAHQVTGRELIARLRLEPHLASHEFWMEIDNALSCLLWYSLLADDPIE